MLFIMHKSTKLPIRLRKEAYRQYLDWIKIQVIADYYHVHRNLIWRIVKRWKQWDWLRGQERLCRERAEQNDVEIVWVYTDWWRKGDYANSQTRDWLNEMIEFLKKENAEYTKVHFVVVDDMDRVIRDVQWRREIKAKIEQLWWAKIYSLKQKVEDTPEWKMIQSITMSVKQYQRESNARQVKDKQRARILNGYRPFYSPAWYKHIKTKTEWKILKLSDEAPLIKEALILFSEWLLNSQTDVVEFLNSKWFRTRQWNKGVNGSFWLIF